MISEQIADIIDIVADKLGCAHTNNQLLNYGVRYGNNSVYVDRIDESIRVIVFSIGDMQQIEYAINEELAKVNYKLVKYSENKSTDITFKIVQL